MMSPRPQNTRWSCPHCGASGWDNPGQRTSGRFDHDRPDGNRCQRAATDLKKGKRTDSGQLLDVLRSEGRHDYPPELLSQLADRYAELRSGEGIIDIGQVSRSGRRVAEDALEIRIPTIEWQQINGDMDPGAHGGTIATADGDRIELLKIQPVREYVGDREAAEVGFPFWTREASYDLSDLDPSKPDVKSALRSVGLEDDSLHDLTPEQRALVIADALLDHGVGAEEGPAGWSSDILHQPVKWYSGQVAGAEYLADEDEAYRDEVLGYDDIRTALEAKVGEMADQSSAQAWSTLGDEMRDQLEEAGFDAQSAVGVAEFGDAVAANGELTDENVDSSLEDRGFELTDFGGRVPTDETEVQTDHAVRAVAKELDRSEEDVEAAAEGLDWWGKTIAWSTSGYSAVWAKRKGAANEGAGVSESNRKVASMHVGPRTSMGYYVERPHPRGRAKPIAGPFATRKQANDKLVELQRRKR